MSKEIISFYNTKGKCLWDWERKAVLKQQETISRQTLTRKVVDGILDWNNEIPEENIAVRSIMMFLFDLKWNTYIIQRSNDKPENPWLWDKSVWWHVVKWDSYNKTAKKELEEELWITSRIINKADNIEEEIRKVDLNNIAILERVWVLHNYISVRTTLTENDYWYKLINVWLYIWVYDWDVIFADNEAQWKKMIPMNLLEEEIKNNSELYTEDMVTLINKYKILARMLSVSEKIKTIIA